MRHDSIGEPPVSPPDEAENMCHECGEGHVVYDSHERSYDCENPDCDYSEGYDWDTHAEALAESRADFW